MFSEARLFGIVCFHIQSISDRNTIQYSESLVMLSNLIHIILHLKLSFGVCVCVCFWVVFVYVHASVHAWVGLLFCLFVEEEGGHFCVCTDEALPGHHWQLRSKQFSPQPQQAQKYTEICASYFFESPFCRARSWPSQNSVKPSKHFTFILRESIQIGGIGKQLEREREREREREMERKVVGWEEEGGRN